MNQTRALETGTTAAPPLTGGARLVVALDRGIYRIARHWLLFVNLLLGAHVASLLLAPWLRSQGAEGLADAVYGFNGLFCHQEPERSFVLFGQPVAVCQRCLAIYAAIFAVSLLFTWFAAGVRRARPLELGLLVAPMVVDGLGQLAGFWESTAVSRVLTGALFGIALAWLLLPYLEQGFTKMRLQIETLFARLVAEGRARPLSSSIG